MKQYARRFRSLDGETVFTAILLGIALYMFYGTYDFSSRAATFPRAIAGAAIVGCALLLVSRYLPRPIRVLVEEEANIVDHSDEELPDEPADTENETKPINSVLTAALIAGYIILAYLLGFYVATPVFVIGYIVLLEINRIYGAVLLVTSLAIVYGFETTLGVPLNEGVFLFAGSF